MDNYFQTLFDVNVNDKTEKKNGLTYVSWPYAWAEVKKRFPDATYTIYENADGWNYHTDGRTAWVKTGVTVNGIEHIEYLPVMDHRNKSIPLEAINSFDVNKAIQRSLTKAVARHGLGLYIYAGEDLPESEADEKPAEKKQVAPPDASVRCSDCGGPIKQVKVGNKVMPPLEISMKTTSTYGRPLCYECAMNAKALNAKEAPRAD